MIFGGVSSVCNLCEKYTEIYGEISAFERQKRIKNGEVSFVKCYRINDNFTKKDLPCCENDGILTLI